LFRNIDGKARRRETNSKTKDLSGLIILKLMLGLGGTDWIDLAQDRNQWRDLVNTVMNLRAYKILGNFLVPAQLVACQEGLGSVELVGLKSLRIVAPVDTNTNLGVDYCGMER
jgi:hypothetical protein